MKGSNTLRNHHPERHSYPADKMIPRGIIKQMSSFKGPPIIALKKMHTKKSRAYNKNMNNFI